MKLGGVSRFSFASESSEADISTSAGADFRSGDMHGVGVSLKLRRLNIRKSECEN